jgi:hypothetical protein
LPLNSFPAVLLRSPILVRAALAVIGQGAERLQISRRKAQIPVAVERLGVIDIHAPRRLLPTGRRRRADDSTKSILVTTSDFGSDGYKFANP